jgi:hypothetical protein
MTEQVPTRVSLYMQVTGGRVRAAEFRWHTETGVTLVVHDRDRGGGLAQTYYDRGAPFDAEQRSVDPRTEPATFMRVLLQPSRMTYYQFVDESNEPDATTGP